ncbi:unnamed protein product [Cyprideis torosa]|uniref:Uncharacterized protein n=1 Tax=Cyprideis torosa TaxID=163714 RepID=A0A7R8W4V2_9CRUS|nr:unnamed protein product [Cyprideis torosa]CAG0880205.1 unnamed protein product [Cyprideis torosa]
MEFHFNDLLARRDSLHSLTREGGDLKLNERSRGVFGLPVPQFGFTFKDFEPPLPPPPPESIKPFLPNVPPGLELRASRIDEGYGVWTRQEIVKGTRFGPFLGRWAPQPVNPKFAWEFGFTFKDFEPPLPPPPPESIKPFLPNVPPGLELRASRIDEGYGVWTRQEIVKGTRFGPFLGRWAPQPVNPKFAWEPSQRQAVRQAAGDKVASSLLSWVDGVENAPLPA